MLKTTIKNYIHKHNNYTLQTTPKYLNTYTGELSNTPIMESIYNILYYHNKHTLPYITSWTKFHT